MIVDITYGPLPYAWIQHENTSYRHLPGRTAKYVETPLMAAGPGLRLATGDAR
jgi:hypothetical protein